MSRKNKLILFIAYIFIISFSLENVLIAGPKRLRTASSSIEGQPDSKKLKKEETGNGERALVLCGGSSTERALSLLLSEKKDLLESEKEILSDDFWNEVTRSLADCVKQRDTKNIIKFLSVFSNSKFENSLRKNVLHFLAENDFADEISFLLGKEIEAQISLFIPSVNDSDLHGRTPLYYAVTNGHETATSTLLENGSNTDYLDENGFNLLHIATDKGFERVVFVLLNHELSKYYDPSRNDKFIIPEINFNINQKTTAGENILHLASKRGFGKVIFVITDTINKTKDKLFKLEINLTDNDGKTPLHYSITRGDVESSRILLENGAAVDLLDDMGRTPLFCLIEREDFPILAQRSNMINLLVSEYNADCDVIDKTGKALMDCLPDSCDVKRLLKLKSERNKFIREQQAKKKKKSYCSIM